MCFSRERAKYTLNGGFLTLVDNFTYLSSSVSSTESNVNIRPAKAWTAIDGVSIVWESYLSEKYFFQAADMSVLLYGCTPRTLSKRPEKKLDANSTRMLQVTLYIYIQQMLKAALHEKHLYSHLPLIIKAIQIRWMRHTGHCWRSKNELVLGNRQERTYSSTTQTQVAV